MFNFTITFSTTSLFLCLCGQLHAFIRLLGFDFGAVGSFLDSVHSFNADVKAAWLVTMKLVFEQLPVHGRPPCLWFLVFP